MSDQDERNEARDLARDETRDPLRDEGRDAGRDVMRDAERDPLRDLSRDEVRDPIRDDARDPLRDVPRDDVRDASFHARMVSLQDSLDRLEIEIANENRLRAIRIAKNERAIRWAIRVSVVSVLVGVLGVLGVLGVFRNEQNSRTSTRQARLGACVQYNLQEKQGILADRAQIDNLVGFNAKKQTAQQRANIAAFLPGYYATITKGHPLRDCTPAGIAAYYSGHGPSPTTKGK